MSATKFFHLPELVDALALHLTPRDLPQLMQTDSVLHEICASPFYRSLDLEEESRSKRLWSPQDSRQALAKNAHHVRHLVANSRLLNILYSEQGDDNSGRQPDNMPARPAKQTITQLTRLTQLRCTVGDEPLHLHRSRSSSAAFRLAAQNPGLTYLMVWSVDLREDMASGLLTRTLSGFDHLSYLELVHTWRGELPAQIIQDIWISCPPSIERLYLKFQVLERPNAEELWIRRQEPLQKLKELQLPLYEDGYPADIVCPILEQCPALEIWDVTFTRGAGHRETVAKTVKAQCPQLQHLLIDSEGNGEDIIAVMDTITPQQIRSCNIQRYVEGIPDQLGIALQRHSTMLTMIRLSKTGTIRSGTIRRILGTCEVLEYLAITSGHPSLTTITGDHPDRIAISLEDAVASEWACRRIRHLELTLDIYHYLADYGNRLYWTDGQLSERRWKEIETLYDQIGRLVHLRVLALKIGIAVNSSSDDSEVEKTRYEALSFPRLLNLPDPERQTQGYLSSLAGLSELRELRGSVRAVTKETKTSLGQKEVEWIVDHWPKVELIEFLPSNHEKRLDVEVPKHLQWLQQRCPHVRLSLQEP
ncbi:hypothetical protein BC939DRAFT_447144 [Gamsiella multidivaricata]|uniref:uncharacterized protein n=1 Tax=Gamsiella multidivaricata TaxID=101098 RepID=UPI00221E8823|nr:uncharacterized protein BC939DRAFT_447144 [Gamsiella multidivaricata]KAG0368312.1 hypothetical protein BGZ54_002226 [Gamsiella multidivaricata]KAI7826175.1 hypothetical protein BC939DRAFT_447144 [Gamsiella multidivaricata]